MRSGQAAILGAVGAVLVWASAGTMCPAETHLQVAANRVVLPHLDNSDVSAYPSVERLSDGRLISVFSAVVKQREGKFVLAASFSTDNGLSWSKPEIVLDTQEGQDYDPSIIVIGDRIIVTATTTPIAEKGISTSRTMAVRSEDSGRSWSKPYEIATGRRYTSGKINNGIVLKDGTALLGYTWEKNLEDPAIERLSSEGEMEEVNAVLVSFDKGSTWTSSQSVYLDTRRATEAKDAINGVCEPALVECQDGSVFMLARTGLQSLYSSRSIDGGRTWSTPEATQLVSHNAPAAMCKIGGEQAGVFAVWNNSPTNRWPLSGAVSFDDCHTWSAATEIANQPGLESSYPGCVQAADGAIVVVYQQATKVGRDIVCTRIDLEGGTLHDEAARSSKVGTAAADMSGGAPRRVAHYDSMPKPVALADGGFAAYFIDHEGPGLAPTPLEQTVYARYSRDGESWSEPEIVATLPSDAGGFGYFVPLVDQRGEAHIFALCDGGTGAVRPRAAGSGDPVIEPLASQRLDVWHLKSLDGRTRWTKPRSIWQGRAGDLQSVTQLKSGRIVLPVCYYVDRSWSNRGEGPAQFTYNGQFDTTVLYSDDLGETWQQSASVLRTPTPDLASYGAVEPIVQELKDGRVWMLLRTQLGRFYESFSSDGSEWSAASPSNITSSDSPAALSRLPDGRLLMVWNNCQRHPYAQGSRHVLHAAVSADDGKTWRGYREILRDAKRDVPPPPSGDHGVSYPFMAINKDGLVLYSMWVETGEGRSLQMFDPAWLEERTASLDISSGLAELSTFGTLGVSMADDPVEAGKKVLSLERQSTEYPAAAVWNFPAARSGEITFEVYRDEHTPAAQVELTDHFSPPADEQSQYFSVFRTAIGDPGDRDAQIGVEPAKWTKVSIRWDGTQRLAQAGAVGGATSTIHQQHETVGPNYVRFVMPKGSVSPHRLLIRNVSVDLGASNNFAVATP